MFNRSPNEDARSGQQPDRRVVAAGKADAADACGRFVCPVCGAQPIEIRGKLQCQRCHTILETCCEGGRT